METYIISNTCNYFFYELSPICHLSITFQQEEHDPVKEVNSRIELNLIFNFFLHMNRIKTDWGQKHLDNLIISEVGPSMEDFNLHHVTNAWYNKKSHTCEEGEAHLTISFQHLLMNLKNK